MARLRKMSVGMRPHGLSLRDALPSYRANDGYKPLPLLQHAGQVLEN